MAALKRNGKVEGWRVTGAIVQTRIRSEKVKRAVRLVLAHGWTQSEAADKCKLGRQDVYRALKIVRAKLGARL